MSEGFRHCFERAVTEGGSMSWYIDIDEGKLEGEISWDVSPDVDCRRPNSSCVRHRDRTGDQSRKRTLLIQPPMTTRSVLEHCDE